MNMRRMSRSKALQTPRALLTGNSIFNFPINLITYTFPSRSKQFSSQVHECQSLSDDCGKISKPKN